MPRQVNQTIEEAAGEAVRQALREHTGDILVFLPGLREINRTASLLEERLPGSAYLALLHGGLDLKLQDKAIHPAPDGKRKIVLATSIAETSLTLEGVRVVIDSGLSRVPRFEPATGLTRLETVRAARSSVALLAIVLFAATAVQIWIRSTKRDWRAALRLVEAGGLLVAAFVCAANYVFFVV